MQTRIQPDAEYFFSGDDPFLSSDPTIRVRLAQLGHAYENVTLIGYRSLAEKLRREAYQLRALQRFGLN